MRATWWPSNPNVLGGRDLARPVHGTWLGITRQGRIAVLTNFREETEAFANAATVSRGEITKEFLLSEKDVEDWIQEVLKTGVYKDVGGFSLVCGLLGEQKYTVLSNRSSLEKGLDYVGMEEYVSVGLSNSLIHDEYPKVKQGKKLVDDLTKDDIDNEEEFIEKAFELLSYVSPLHLANGRTNSFKMTPTVDTLRNSIFIPRYATPALPSIPADHRTDVPEWGNCHIPRLYGTREQTVILVSREDGRVVYTERTLYDEQGEPQSREEGETKIEFHIEGWRKLA
jgi:uncharacterized protein with NRDE domain